MQDLLIAAPRVSRVSVCTYHQCLAEVMARYGMQVIPTGKLNIMGQYYMIINLDQEEYLHPHKFGDGLKLMEFGCSSYGIMTGLAVLLADGNGRGGGDLHSSNPIVGSWARNRIIVAGDYANSEHDEEGGNLHHRAMKGVYTDISEDVLSALRDDMHYRQATQNRVRSVTRQQEDYISNRVQAVNE